MVRMGREFYIAASIALISAGCGPDDTERLYEIRSKGRAILQKQQQTKAHVPISMLFNGDGVCLSRGSPSLRQLEKKSPQEFHQLIPLLERYLHEKTGGGASWGGGESYTLFLVRYDQLLEAIKIPDGSVMVAASGEGCHRSSETVLLGAPEGDERPIGLEFTSGR